MSVTVWAWRYIGDFAKRSYLKATGSGKTTWRRSGLGDGASEVLSKGRLPSRLWSPAIGMLSLGVELLVMRVELRWAVSLVRVVSSSL